MCGWELGEEEGGYGEEGWGAACSSRRGHVAAVMEGASVVV